MVPNLLSLRPFNAPLLRRQRLRVSSLSSPRREIGLMKLKGMKLSQHCGFQRHCFITPHAPQTHITPTSYKAAHKRPLSLTLHQWILLSLSECQHSGEPPRPTVSGTCPGCFRIELKNQTDIDRCVYHLGASRHFHACSDPVKHALTLPFWLGVTLVGMQRKDYFVCVSVCVCVCVCYINMISSWHIIYSFLPPFWTIAGKRISNWIFRSRFRTCRELGMIKKKMNKYQRTA